MSEVMKDWFSNTDGAVCGQCYDTAQIKDYLIDIKYDIKRLRTQMDEFHKRLEDREGSATT